MPSKKKKRKIGFKKTILLLLFICGISTIIYGFYLKYRSKVLSFSQEPSFEKYVKDKYSLPAFIKIEKANISIPVVAKNISDGVWEVSDKYANFLEISSKPEEGGNIVIYGHNKSSIFGNIINSDLIGDIVEITTEDNNKYYYEITKKMIIEPSEMEYVEPTDYEVLTIYTCTGFLDSRRLVVKALPFKK